jgi:hypothetical protein
MSVSKIGTVVDYFNKFWWVAPEYFSRWRVFPRAFISIYIYIVWYSSTWFTALVDPTQWQTIGYTAILGVGAAWFAIYTGSKSTPSENYKIDTSQTKPDPVPDENADK